jgi:HTH-type transcriptional regulator/antitoxin HigA
MAIRPIRNADDHREALARLEEICAPALGSPEADEFEILGTLVDAYERRAFPIAPPTSAGARELRPEHAGASMHYLAVITHEGDRTLAEFPDCPGCQTFADSDGDIGASAKDALEGWLESSIANGDDIRPPSAHVEVPEGAASLRVEIDAVTSAAVKASWARRRTPREATSELADEENEPPTPPTPAQFVIVLRKLAKRIEAGETMPEPELVEAIVEELEDRIDIEAIAARDPNEEGIPFAEFLAQRDRK